MLSGLIKPFFCCIFFCFLYTDSLHAQLLEKSKLDIGFSLGYQFLQPVFSNQSILTLGPMTAINKGGYGFLGSVRISRNFNKWYMFTSVDLSMTKISEILVINRNGQNSEISVNHRPSYLIPNLGIGRYCNLGKKMQSSIDFGLGFLGFVGKNDLTDAVKIYDPLNNANNYYEYDIHYSRSNPFSGNARLELCYPLAKNENIIWS